MNRKKERVRGMNEKKKKLTHTQWEANARSAHIRCMTWKSTWLLRKLYILTIYVWNWTEACKFTIIITASPYYHTQYVHIWWKPPMNFLLKQVDNENYFLCMQLWSKRSDCYYCSILISSLHSLAVCRSINGPCMKRKKRRKRVRHRKQRGEVKKRQI